ncbi:hypothetical protein HII31_11015 [Pseudocercospora fuligena]|uniref:Uncharacterized protein n=1 Tax=Pseudocercospora fuligena TaxID=685502 RepID=A0A8H6RAR7_9PEZI|nr:hypothetical protein HII31_11015 [Pseudocercospora fuligena]
MNKTQDGRIVKRQLPKSASVSKRPLLRPAIPSPYAGSSQQKVIYVGSKTPFLSAVKRCEKLLHLAEKRLVQAGTQSAKNKRRRGGDEIQGIAEEVEVLKKKKDGRNEEIVIKGTGKAISKVLELAVWFQDREEYVVRLKTGSVGAVDDVRFDGEDESRQEAGDVTVGGENEMPDEEGSKPVVKRKRKQKEGVTRVVKREENEGDDGKREVHETQIRQVSVLEVYVSLR